MEKEKQEFINIRVPTSMKRVLKVKAKKEHRSLSSYVRMVYLKVMEK